MINTLTSQPLYKPVFVAYLPCTLDIANELGEMMHYLITNSIVHEVFSALVSEIIHAVVVGDPDSVYQIPKLLEIDEMCGYSYGYDIASHGYGVTYNDLALLFVGLLIPIVESNKEFLMQCSFIWMKQFKTSSLDITLLPNSAIISVIIDVNVPYSTTQNHHPLTPSGFV